MLLTLFIMLAWPSGIQAAPLVTPYFSLSIPAGWKILSGPETNGKAVTLQLCDDAHTAVVAFAVGPVRHGEAEEAAQMYARRLKGSKPSKHAGQIEFSFGHGSEKGIGIVREDKATGLALVMIISGNLAITDFVYAMRGSYKRLYPVRP